MTIVECFSLINHKAFASEVVTCLGNWFKRVPFQSVMFYMFWSGIYVLLGACYSRYEVDVNTGHSWKIVM